MTDLLAVAVLAVIIGCAARYVYRAKKNGAKCIGCSVEGDCPHKKAGTCTCHTDARP